MKAKYYFLYIQSSRSVGYVAGHFSKIEYYFLYVHSKLKFNSEFRVLFNWKVVVADHFLFINDIFKYTRITIYQFSCIL